MDKEELNKYIDKVKSTDIAELSEEERVSLIEEGLSKLPKKEVQEAPKRSMRDIVDEQATFVRIKGVDVPAPIRGIADNDLELIDNMIETRKATEEATYSAIGTVVSLLVTAAMFVK